MTTLILLYSVTNHLMRLSPMCFMGGHVCGSDRSPDRRAEILQLPLDSTCSIQDGNIERRTASLTKYASCESFGITCFPCRRDNQACWLLKPLSDSAVSQAYFAARSKSSVPQILRPTWQV
jgi:hypothetical protein